MTQTTQHQNLTKAIERLEGDLDPLGWDQPARLYTILGDIDDPILNLLGEVPGHPCDSFQEGYDNGYRFSPEALGIAIANEGWRHLELRELFERAPQILQGINDAYHRDTGQVADPVEMSELAAKHLQEYYNNEVLPRLPGPASLPDHMRVEIRTVTAVLRDGTQVAVARSRGDSEVSTYHADRDLLKMANVPSFMYQYLHGLRPEHVEDPVQAVADFYEVQAIGRTPN